VDRKEKAKGRRQKKAAWAGNRQMLVGSNNRKWAGKRRPKAEGRRAGNRQLLMGSRQYRAEGMDHYEERLSQGGIARRDYTVGSTGDRR
jgi:hypothetical protein